MCAAGTRPVTGTNTLRSWERVQFVCHCRALPISCCHFRLLLLEGVCSLHCLASLFWCYRRRLSVSVLQCNSPALFLCRPSGTGKLSRRSRLFTRASTTWCSWWQPATSLKLPSSCAKLVLNAFRFLPIQVCHEGPHQVRSCMMQDTDSSH